MDLRSRPLVVGLICVVAIVLAAATLTTAVDVGGGFGSGPGIGEGATDDGSEAPTTGGEDQSIGGAGEPLFGDLCIEIAAHPLITLAIFGSLLGFGLLVWMKTGLIAATAITGIIAFPVVIILMLLTAGCAEPNLVTETTDAVGEQASSLSGDDGGLGVGDDGTIDVDLAIPAMLLAVGLLLGGAALVIALRGSDSTSQDTQEIASVDSGNDTFVAQRQDSSMDPLDEDLDPDNLVYRAWGEMAQAVSPDNAEPMTPADYAQVAIESGLDQEAVLTLTRQFQAVRYGTATVTEDRAAAVISALQTLADQQDSIDTGWIQEVKET